MDYSAEVQRRFATARAAAGDAGELADAVRGEAGDRALNVWARFLVQSSAGRIDAVRFQVYGCPHTVAAADWLAERLRERPVAELARWDVHALAAELEIPLEKFGRLLVLQDALAVCHAACVGREG